MVSTDPIADMFSRIRNAAAVNKNEVSLPHSNIKEAIGLILAENGFLTRVSAEGKDKHKTLNIVIFPENGSPTFSAISRASKPGRRIYTKSGQIPLVKSGRGITIISTSQGIMTGRDAKTKKLGGELVCEVY